VIHVFFDKIRCAKLYNQFIIILAIAEHQITELTEQNPEQGREKKNTRKSQVKLVHSKSKSLGKEK
jgi:hypothetical protein